MHTRDIRNRIGAVMEHTARYSFKGRARLAADAGVSKSTITRLLNGDCCPSWAMLRSVTQALERAVGRKMDPRELVSFDGRYPTKYVCRLVGCPGCLPECAYDGDGNLLPEYEGVKPGEWTDHVLNEEAE